MSRHRANIALALLLAVGLAGCTTAPAPPEGPAMPAPGTIEGRVIDMVGLPVPDATVALLPTERRATTDAHGSFRLDGVEPGPAVLAATKPGYSSSTLRGTVAEGGLLTLDFRLASAPRLDPYNLLLTFDGVIPCGLPAGVTCGLVADELPQHHFEVDAGLGGIVYELTWTPPTEAVAAPLRLDAAAATADVCGEAFATATGASVLRLAVEEGFPIAGGHQCALVVPGEGVVVQQGYTLRVTLFYHMGPPSGYSALA